MNARYFEFGLPPSGEHTDLCAGPAIPTGLLPIVASRYEQSYPGVFVLAGVVDDWFCLYHRTKSLAWKKDMTRQIVIDPAGRAKGPGFILMCIEIASEKWAAPIASSGFNDRIGAWMEERAEAIASMLSVPYERLALGADAYDAQPGEF